MVMGYNSLWILKTNSDHEAIETEVKVGKTSSLPCRNFPLRAGQYLIVPFWNVVPNPFEITFIIVDDLGPDTLLFE